MMLSVLGSPPKWNFNKGSKISLGYFRNRFKSKFSATRPKTNKTIISQKPPSFWKNRTISTTCWKSKGKTTWANGPAMGPFCAIIPKPSYGSRTNTTMSPPVTRKTWRYSSPVRRVARWWLGVGMQVRSSLLGRWVRGCGFWRLGREGLMGVFRRRDWIVWRKVSCDFYFLAIFCYFLLFFFGV